MSCVDMPGQSRQIRRIDFNCRSVGAPVTRSISPPTSDGTGPIGVAAPIGIACGRACSIGDDTPVSCWRSGWRSSGGPLNAGWVTLGTELFDGRIDRETTIAGLGGRNVERLAIRAVNDDARCSRITATFANGTTRDLNIGEGELLREDRIYELDLPGGRRDVIADRHDLPRRERQAGDDDGDGQPLNGSRPS